MVLKKNYLLLFIFLVICFYGFSDVPLEKILENPFSVSPLIFDNDNIYFIEQNISLKDEDIFIDYVINNQSDNDIILPIKIICEIVADSKIVNDICLPTPITFKAICKTLSCAPLDIYEPCEIELKERQQETETKGAAAVLTEGARRSRERRKRNNLYNLTVEIPRDVAERVFSPESLRKLGYLSKTDFVRQAVAELDKRLYNLNKK